MIQFPLPVESERETVIRIVTDLVNRTSTDLLISYLPVLARFAEQPPQAHLRLAPTEELC